MPSSQRKSVTASRRRLKRHSFVRVEVHVRKDDAALIRGVAQALSDPAREAEARALLREHFGANKAKIFKAFRRHTDVAGDGNLPPNEMRRSRKPGGQAT